MVGTQSKRETPHVLIVGAGAAGLFIAQGLKKAGISSTVYERYAEEKYYERSGQWTMALHWSLPLIEKLLPPDLYSQLHTAFTNRWEEPDNTVASKIPIKNGATGELLAQIPMPSPQRVVRGKLRNLIRNDIEVHFGKRLTDLKIEDDGVLAIFNDGELSAKGSLIIGADGARSTVRNHLVPASASALDEAPTTSLTIFRSFPREQALYLRDRIHPIVNLLPHPALNSHIFSTVIDIVDPEKPETWIFQISVSFWSKDPVPGPIESRRLIKEFLSVYCEPFRSVGDWTSDDIPVSSEKYHYWGKICPWENLGGRAVLVGDAAHPMTPHRAQGLNSAIQDADEVVDAIKKAVHEDQDMKSLLDVYAESAYKRGKVDIDMSVKQMYSYHHFEALMNGPLMNGGYNKANVSG